MTMQTSGRANKAGPPARWAPPDGLERGRPRHLRLTALGRWVIALAIVLGVGALAAFVLLQAEAQRKLEDVRLLREQGVVASAPVTRRWRTRDEDPSHWIAYTLPSETRGRETARRVPERTWRTLPDAGGTVAVRYVPGREELSHLDGLEPRPQPAFVPFLVGGLLLAGSALSLALPLAQRRLLGEGRVARATVTTRGKGGPGEASFRYEFATLSGRKVGGKGLLGTTTPAVGGLLTVVYDPDPPHRHATYPFSLVQPAEKRPLRR
jgi:hypothetical protein